MSRINLSGMEFFAYHGHLAEEQILGNKFIVDLMFEADTSQAEESDELSGTINYQEVYNLVKMEMMTTSHLLEHIGSRIVDTVYEAFPSIEKLEVTVSKLHPPLNGKVDRVSVTISR